MKEHHRSAVKRLHLRTPKNRIRPHHREILAALWVCRCCQLVLQRLLLCMKRGSCQLLAQKRISKSEKHEKWIQKNEKWEIFNPRKFHGKKIQTYRKDEKLVNLGYYRKNKFTNLRYYSLLGHRSDSKNWKRGNLSILAQVWKILLSVFWSSINFKNFKFQ